jgi:hypothetical protein
MTDPDFEIFLTVKGQKFRMKVYWLHSGDSVEQFRIVGGTRSIVLQSNRPQLKKENSRKAIDWKLLDGDLGKGSAKEVAETLNNIIVEIELKIKDQLPPMESTTGK